MHLAAPQVGVIGASAVVASTISHAVGAALISKIRQEKRVFVANFGDGATEQGVFHESLNFASLHILPVLFLCEDNQLAVHAPKLQRQSYALKELVEAYSIEFYELEEGYDLIKVYELAKKTTKIVREMQRPVFVRIKTSRYKEHVGPGEDFNAGYRSEMEIRAWQANDPLCTDTELISKYMREIHTEISEAVMAAESSPAPTEKDLLTDVE